jgi:hypothetical protein
MACLCFDVEAMQPARHAPFGCRRNAFKVIGCHKMIHRHAQETKEESSYLLGRVGSLGAVAMIAVARWNFLPAPLAIDLASLSILAVVVQRWWEMVWEFGVR